ncbi:N-acetylglucosaminyl transferase component [Colletotrichum acutatum]
MSASLAPECNEVKERYDTCFLKWYSEKYLRGTGTDNNECADLFKNYQKCLTVALKERGIDKLLDEAREDQKDNDATYMGRKYSQVSLNLSERNSWDADNGVIPQVPHKLIDPILSCALPRSASSTFTPSAVQTAETQEYPRPHPSTTPRPVFFFSSPPEHLCAKQHDTNCGATPTDSNHRTKPVLARPSSSSKSSPRHLESSLRPHDPFQASTPLFPPALVPQSPPPSLQSDAQSRSFPPRHTSTSPWRQASACTIQENNDSMHPLSVLSLGIFVAGYITARWDLVTRLYELAIFAWDYGVITRAAKGFALLTFVYLVIFIPVERLATKEANLRSDLPGVVVGWRNSSLDVFVVAILDDVDAGHVEFALKIGTLFRNSPHPVNSIYERCGHNAMHVLGLTNPSEAVVLDPSLFIATTPAGAKSPRIACAKALSIQIILYDRPRPSRMQYISLNPISLALGNKEAPGLPPTEHMAEEERQELKVKEEKRKLVEKLKQHTIIKRSPSPKERALPKIVNQINWSWELEQLLQKNISRIGTRPKRSLSVSERVVEHATSMRNFVWDLLIFYLLPLIQWGFVYMLMGHRAVAELLLQILEFRLRDDYLALKDISATAQQVEIRLQQFCYWPMQYTTLRQRKNDWESVTTSHPDYIRFYNSLWLVANDVIIGIALGSYIIDNAEWAANAISELLRVYTVEALQRSISWLMGWPAGLKLNSELALFLGDLFLWVIDYWSNCIATLQPLLPHIIWFIGFSSFAGASMPIAMFSDLLSSLTVHIYSFYLASARIYHWQLTILISLFHLFRGKKHNVLRNRIDSCDYDLDQLLVGTILFTLLFFLLPTVVVFYLNFAVARMVIISLKAVFDTLLSCLNHFPLFALMLRVKDPRRLPGGIRFELRDTLDYRLNNASNEPPTSVIYLKSIPLTFRAMFHQYFQMGNRIRKHYLSPTVVLCLVTGKFVPPLNRKNLYSLQYSMLPARRASFRQMWDAITTVQPNFLYIFDLGPHIILPP